MKNRYEEEEIIQKVKSLTNAATLPLCELNTEDYKVELIADETVSPANFRPSKLVPNTYYAHPLTIRALRKNIFATGECLEDMAVEFNCIQCDKTIDAQFWKFCPFCEASIPQDLLHPRFSEK